MSQSAPPITDTLTDGVGHTPMVRIGTHNYSKYIYIFVFYFKKNRCMLIL